MKELLVIIIALLLIISVQLYYSKSLIQTPPERIVVTDPVTEPVSKSQNIETTHHKHIHNHRLSTTPDFLVPNRVIIEEVRTNPPINHIPINIPTRGPSESYRQIGVLTNGDNSMILPLFGRNVWNGSSKWNYYTQTDKFVSVHLPVFSKDRDCSAEYGCDELFDKDEVTVPQFNETFVVTLYHLEGPRYIPCVKC